MSIAQLFITFLYILYYIILLLGVCVSSVVDVAVVVYENTIGC
jgi:hypothetical protein